MRCVWCVVRCLGVVCDVRGIYRSEPHLGKQDLDLALVDPRFAVDAREIDPEEGDALETADFDGKREVGRGGQLEGTGKDVVGQVIVDGTIVEGRGDACQRLLEQPRGGRLDREGALDHPELGPFCKLLRI